MLLALQTKNENNLPVFYSAIIFSELKNRNQKVQ